MQWWCVGLVLLVVATTAAAQGTVGGVVEGVIGGDIRIDGGTVTEAEFQLLEFQGVGRGDIDHRIRMVSGFTYMQAREDTYMDSGTGVYWAGLGNGHKDRVASMAAAGSQYEDDAMLAIIQMDGFEPPRVTLVAECLNVEAEKAREYEFPEYVSSNGLWGPTQVTARNAVSVTGCSVDYKIVVTGDFAMSMWGWYFGVNGTHWQTGEPVVENYDSGRFPTVDETSGPPGAIQSSMGFNKQTYGWVEDGRIEIVLHAKDVLNLLLHGATTNTTGPATLIVSGGNAEVQDLVVGSVLAWEYIKKDLVSVGLALPGGQDEQVGSLPVEQPPVIELGGEAEAAASLGVAVAPIGGQDTFLRPAYGLMIAAAVAFAVVIAVKIVVRGRRYEVCHNHQQRLVAESKTCKASLLAVLMYVAAPGRVEGWIGHAEAAMQRGRHTQATFLYKCAIRAAGDAQEVVAALKYQVARAFALRHQTVLSRRWLMGASQHDKCYFMRAVQDPAFQDFN